MNKKLFLLVPVAFLAGCTSAAQRMNDCEAQGISRDACYVAEQNRQNGINAQAQAQAMRNAQALYPVEPAAGYKHHHDSTQFAQAAHKNRDTISCDDLRRFIEAGIALTPGQQKQIPNCHINTAPATRTVKGYGVTVRIDGQQVYIDDKPAARDEHGETSDVYSQGFYQVVLYKSGKVALLKNRVVQGYLH